VIEKPSPNPDPKITEKMCNCEVMNQTPQRPPESFFSKISSRVKEFFVQDIPAELQACESCLDFNCTQSQWESCKMRIDIAKKLQQ
jgi:hypothetical protein